MGLYYFDIQIGETRSVDQEGADYPDVDTARAEAGLTLCRLGREMLQSRGVIEEITIWVRDELGEVMQGKLSFRMSRLN